MSLSDQSYPIYLLGSGSDKRYDRDKICNIKGSFCNLFDSDGIPIFDAFIDYLIVNHVSKANEWASRLKDDGATHINLDISGDYNENLGWAPRYPIPGTDWTKNIDGFKRIMDWVLNRGFIVHLHLSTDGQGYDPNGMTYGWQWGIDNLPIILPQLKDYKKNTLFNTGWDGCFPDHTLTQTQALFVMMRDVLGDDAYLAAELSGPGSVGYCHFGGGGADWYLIGIEEIDAYCIELMTYPPNKDGVEQTAARMLGPAAKNIESPDAGPYYLAAPRKRPLAINLFESIAYQASRKLVTERDARTVASFCANYGFVNFGNGQPF